jgi:hypothetical protein
MRDAVTKEVIESLISDGVCESRQLDYKRDWVGRTDNDKKEFLADVVAFANTIGGTMLFGVDEERDSDGKQTGAPREALGCRTWRSRSSMAFPAAQSLQFTSPAVTALRIWSHSNHRRSFLRAWTEVATHLTSMSCEMRFSEPRQCPHA